ncbi:MAG: methyltransferase [Patescibacteria group bacterium]
MEKDQQNGHKKHVIHSILAHSYLLYFFCFLVGFILDDIFVLQPFDSNFAKPLGLIWMVLSSLFILWAQKTSRNLKIHNISADTFAKGPYKATRIPTHVGLTFLLIGFGIFDNLPFVILTTILSFVITKYTLIKKEEKLLEQKYGEPYAEYKKNVKS